MKFLSTEIKIEWDFPRAYELEARAQNLPLIHF